MEASQVQIAKLSSAYKDNLLNFELPGSLMPEICSSSRILMAKGSKLKHIIMGSGCTPGAPPYIKK